MAYDRHRRDRRRFGWCSLRSHDCQTDHPRPGPGGSAASHVAGSWEVRIAGLANNVPYLKRIVEHPAFISGGVNTGFIGTYREDLETGNAADIADMPFIAAAVLLEAQRLEALRQARLRGDACSPWAMAYGWHLNDTPLHSLTFYNAGHELVLLYRITGGIYVFEREGKQIRIALTLFADGRLNVRIDGVSLQAEAVLEGAAVTILFDGTAHLYVLKTALDSEEEGREESGHVAAPMPGKLIAVHVIEGDEVAKGDALMVLEAMKMEHVIRAPDDGVIGALHFGQGDHVEEGADLLLFETRARFDRQSL